MCVIFHEFSPPYIFSSSISLTHSLTDCLYFSRSASIFLCALHKHFTEQQQKIAHTKHKQYWDHALPVQSKPNWFIAWPMLNTKNWNVCFCIAHFLFLFVERWEKNKLCFLQDLEKKSMCVCEWERSSDFMYMLIANDSN